MVTRRRTFAFSALLRDALHSPTATVLGVTLFGCSSTNAVEPTDAGQSQTREDAATSEDAGLCNDLERAAQAALAASYAQYLACTADSDCVYTSVGTSGACAAACGVLSSASSASAAVAAASSACQTFNADGCPPPLIACPRNPPVVCAAGACTMYDFYVAQTSPSLEHGECAAFALNYQPLGTSPDAPHAIDEALAASDGTLYADAQCTQSLGATGSIAIPAGGTQSPFGFIPTSAGPVRITTDNGTVYLYTAQ